VFLLLWLSPFQQKPDERTSGREGDLPSRSLGGQPEASGTSQVPGSRVEIYRRNSDQGLLGPNHTHVEQCEVRATPKFGVIEQGLIHQELPATELLTRSWRRSIERRNFTLGCKSSRVGEK
jgi:hypothetical protein